MKRLNKKGFTLIELLAVIVILAIVVSITIPAITNTINDSKNNTMKVAVDAAQKWLEDQLALYNTSTDVADANFKQIATSAIASTSTNPLEITDATILNALGMETKDVKQVNIYAKDQTKFCVTIVEIPVSTSKYYNTTYFGTTGFVKNGALNTSSHCNS